MSCDENSFKHNKQTISSEVKTKTAAFMHQSWILVAWINDERPSFLLWLRLRRLVVFGEGIWGCSRCNSTMDFFWVVNLPRLHDGQLWRVFSFKYLWMAPCMSLRDFSPLVSLFVFETSGQNFILRTLASSCGAVCFKIYIFKMAGSGLAPASEDVRSFTALLSGSKDYVCLFTAT